jgi:hypothetical protein
LASGSRITACRRLIVWVPDSFDQLASSPPRISRSSERGYLLFLVVAPPALARNTMPSRESLSRNQSSTKDSSAGG